MKNTFENNHEYPYEKPWRLSEKGQALRKAVVEQLDDPSEHSPASTEAALQLGLMTACIRAHSDGKQLSHEDAQAAAAMLSTAIEDEHGSHLEDIAEDRGIRPGSSREELRALWNRPRLYADAREIANFLGSYVLAEEHPAFTPTAPQDHEAWEHQILHDEETERMIAFHYRSSKHLIPDDATFQALQRSGGMVEMLGDVGLAFLRRPSVDALSDRLPKRFGEEYLFSATHPHLIFQRLYGTADPYPGLAREIELIYAAGMVHAFKRPSLRPLEGEHGK